MKEVLIYGQGGDIRIKPERLEPQKTDLNEKIRTLVRIFENLHSLLFDFFMIELLKYALHVSSDQFEYSLRALEDDELDVLDKIISAAELYE